MKVSSQIIATLLREFDIEGYINFGAPGDEYNSEAEVISLALDQLDRSEINVASIVTVVSEVWKESFDLSNSELELRRPAVENLAKRLVENIGQVSKIS